MMPRLAVMPTWRYLEAMKNMTGDDWESRSFRTSALSR